jgi:hypothetical protein
MDISESWAFDALKMAMPFPDAEKLAEVCARNAVKDLDGYNQKYMAENTWFDDGSVLRSVPMDSNAFERAVQMLSRYYLVLWHRRGLVGS